MEKRKFKYFFIGLLFVAIMLLSVSIASASDNSSTSNSVSTVSATKTVATNQTVSKPSSLSQNAIVSTAKKVNNYVYKNKKLPNSVTISNYKYSMPEFLYLMSKTITNKHKKSSAAIKVKHDVQDPSNPSGTGSKGKIYSVYYYGYANKIVNTVNKYNKIPNYIVTAGGNKLQYQSIVFLFGKVLTNTKSNKLPYYVSVNIRSTTSFNNFMPTYNRYATYTTEKLGSDSDKGYVDFISITGNPSSKVKIAYIIGVHPLESNSHNSLYKNLLASVKNLKYNYFIYKVTVTQGASNYDIGRMNGQLLAQKYVLPHIKSKSYNLVIDIHSNRGTKNGGSYQKTNFIFAPLNSNSSKTIATKIIKNIPGLSYYYPSSQTSPEYYTNPLVQSGIKTIIYESYLYESKAITDNYMKQLITIVDNVKL